MDKELVLEKIRLAILANGGDKWREDWCQCDYSIGFVPCEYCAVYYALTYAKRIIEKP